MPDEQNGIAWRRYLGALYRYKWVLVLGVLLGAGSGYVAARRTIPEYEVHGTVWLAAQTAQDQSSGPIRPGRLMNLSSWPELLNSFRILDSVARKTRLHVLPEANAPRALFAHFETADTFRFGHYELKADVPHQRYELLGAGGMLLERGTLGDSIGRQYGLRWAPAAAEIKSSPVEFTLTTVREASIKLRSRLLPILPNESSLLRLTLTDTDPRRAAETMTNLLNEFVATAAHLKSRNLTEFANTLDQQVNYSAQELRNAELALEDFRVRTITLPSEGNGGAIAAGLEMTRDPVLQHYFTQKLQLDSVHNDRESLARTLAEIQQHRVAPIALWSVPAVHGSPELSGALNELANREAALRTALQLYTEQHRSVIDLRERIAVLTDQVIPQAAASLVETLHRREDDLQGRVDGSSREMRQIPTRTIEELRLRRNVQVRQQLFTMLKSRYEEARLAEAGALPDLSILDYPSVPTWPSRNKRPQIALLFLSAGFGAAVLLALLLDRLDKRFRHPEQATKDLGLEILGVVPFIRAATSNSLRMEQAWQVTEAFRTIRLALLPSHTSGARLLSVTSPASGDGKSLVASNLAVSLAKAGFRTLLIDADVRRGCQHSVFGLRERPGLTDYLAGQAALTEILVRADDELTVVPAGTRGRRAPELLTSRRMTQLIAEVRQSYDAVVVDCAPLNAGVDAFLLAALTTDLVLVLRAGVTDCRLAEAKLRLLDRLPVRVVGTVLNAVRTTGEYRYYAYDYNEAPPPLSRRVARVMAPLVD
jgi:capsular exopolysaccharide synthesis family protein